MADKSTVAVTGAFSALWDDGAMTRGKRFGAGNENIRKFLIDIRPEDGS
jgi:hypothetical protein